MAFDIQLMVNRDPLNKINKSPTTVTTLSGNLRDEADIINPVITIEYSGTLTNVNYMRIATFNRWYFVTKIESVRTNLWRIYGHCDVLKTYSEGILGNYAVVSRNENQYNLLLNDSMFKVYSNPRVQVCNFPQKFSGQSYVLVMNGARHT